MTFSLRQWQSVWRDCNFRWLPRLGSWETGCHVLSSNKRPGYHTGDRRRKQVRLFDPCLVQHLSTDRETKSAQIIMPSKREIKKNDVFVSLYQMHTKSLHETQIHSGYCFDCLRDGKPYKRVEEIMALLGDVALRFDDIQDTYKAFWEQKIMCMSQSLTCNKPLWVWVKRSDGHVWRIMGYPWT